jgi:hypothetical protein
MAASRLSLWFDKLVVGGGFVAVVVVGRGISSAEPGGGRPTSAGATFNKAAPSAGLRAHVGTHTRHSAVGRLSADSVVAR